MSFVNHLKNPFIQQYLLEILLPLIGYYFFEWDLLLIGFYYLIDYFASIFFFLKRAILINQTTNSPLKFYIILGGGISLYLLFFVNFFGFVWQMLHFNADNWPVLVAKMKTLFLSELWFIIPLIFVLFYFKDRMTFRIPRRFLNFNAKRYLLAELIGAAAITLLFFIGLFLWARLDFDGSIVIVIFVCIKIIYDLTIKQKLTNYSILK